MALARKFYNFHRALNASLQNRGLGRGHCIIVGRAHRQYWKVHAVGNVFQRELFAGEACALLQRRCTEKAAYLQSMRDQRVCECLIEKIGKIECGWVSDNRLETLVVCRGVDCQQRPGRS